VSVVMRVKRTRAFAMEASDRRIRRAKTRRVAIDLFVRKERRRVEWRVSVVRRRKVGSSASRSRLGPGFHAPIRRRHRPTTRVADAFAVSHRAIGASPAPPEAVPRGNRKHGFFSRREESLENARPMKDTGETTDLKRTVVFHREKTVARKETNVAHLGAGAAVHRLFQAQHEVGELLLPLLRLGGFPLLKQPQAARIRGDFGSTFARYEPFAGTEVERATREIAMRKTSNAVPACSVRVGTRSVPPASGDVHVLNQDLSARDIGVGLPGLPSIVPAGVIVHHPHRLRPARAVSLLHRARFFRLLPDAHCAMPLSVISNARPFPAKRAPTRCDRRFPPTDPVRARVTPRTA
jgi:hypothetical protein